MNLGNPVMATVRRSMEARAQALNVELQIVNVRGLGEKNFLKLKSQLTVGAANADHDRQDPQ